MSATSPFARFAGPTLLLAMSLFIFTPIDWLINTWPLQLDSAAWRYASVGLFSSSVFTLSLAMLMAAASVSVLEDRVLRWGVCILSWVASVAMLALAIEFALDALQLRGQATSDTIPPTYDLGAVKVVAKYCCASVVLAWCGFLPLRAPVRTGTVLTIGRTQTIYTP